MRVDEMATRALYMINKDSKECLNVGRGEEGGNATTTADLGCSAKNREASGYWTVATRTRTSVGILLHQAKYHRHLALPEMRRLKQQGNICVTLRYIPNPEQVTSQTLCTGKSKSLSIITTNSRTRRCHHFEARSPRSGRHIHPPQDKEKGRRKRSSKASRSKASRGCTCSRRRRGRLCTLLTTLASGTVRNC
jgi:hypothetical protein